MEVSKNDKSDNNIISDNKEVNKIINQEDFKIKIINLTFNVNEKSQSFYTSYIYKDLSNDNINNISKFETVFKYDEIIKELNDAKIETTVYLQKVMESNEKLGATLNIVKDVEEDN